MNLLLALGEAARGRPARGITFLGSKEGPMRATWAELDQLASKTASGLAEAGVAPGDRVLILLPTGIEHVASFLGALALGAIPCPMSPPQGFGSRQVFERRLADLARLVGARVAIAEPDLPPDAARACGLAIHHPAALVAAPARPPRAPDDDEPAFFQFTSGTTEIPKAVVLAHRALVANVRQIAVATGIGPESVIVSWLPLYHDMGLIGGVLTALVTGAELVLMSPMGFLRRPAAWPEAIDRFRGTHSPAPTFAYRYAAERVPPGEAARFDLSSWRVGFVGAETIQPGSLAAFEERFRPAGLAETTVLPCYGLAEASLAVTFDRTDAPWRTLSIGRRALAERSLAREPEGPADALALVSCGRPLAGTTVRIVSDGVPLPERAVGRIEVRGPSLYTGYWGGEPRPAGGALDTGDLGFLDRGELYVTGREKDLIILRGENHHPSEIEWVLSGLPGLREGRVAAFGLPDPDLGTETLCVMAEVDRRAGADPADLEVEIRRRVHDAIGLSVGRVSLVGSGTIPVTTSGKIQRAAARRILLEANP